MAILVGSARHDENGKLVNGKAGDNNGKEVATQAMYTHSKGWYILRPKSSEHADKIAERMQSACANDNIGYDQNQRLGIITHGIDTNSPTECDCSSLVRQCVKEATRKDTGNFTTSNEAAALEATGLFEKKISYIDQSKTPVYNGDVLVTKTKGHTVIVVSGNPRTEIKTATAITSKEVKATGAASKTNKEFSGTYKTTASMLNIRHGGGTNYGVMCSVPKGTIARNYGYYSLDSSGRIWLYIQFEHQGVKYTGFALRDYLLKA